MSSSLPSSPPATPAIPSPSTSRGADSRTATVWVWVAGVGLTGLMVGGGWLSGWGLEPYRATPLGTRLVLAAVGAGLAWLMWARRDVAAGTVGLLSRVRRPTIVLPVLWALFILLRERRYIGDWINIAFALPMRPSWMLNDYILWRAPLTNFLQYIHWMVFLRPFTGVDTLYPWQVLLAFYGVLVVWAQWVVGKAALRGRRAAVLYILLYSTSGILFFSLGHVENYVVPMAAVAATAWISIRAIRRRRGAFWAFLWYGVSVMAHPQCIVFAPSMLVVLVTCFPSRRRALYLLRCTAGMLTVPVLLAGIDWVAGIGVDLRAITGGPPEGTLLPAGQALSLERFNDLLMIMVCVFPALPAAFLAVVLWRRRLPASDRVGLWLALNAAAGFCFCLFIWNKAPMPVDWDLMGPSLMIVWMAMLYGLLRSAPVRRRIQLALCLAVLQLPHTAVWIGWNMTPDPKQQVEIQSLEKSVGQERGVLDIPRKPDTPPVGMKPAGGAPGKRVARS